LTPAHPYFAIKFDVVCAIKTLVLDAKFKAEEIQMMKLGSRFREGFQKP